MGVLPQYDTPKSVVIDGGTLLATATFTLAATRGISLGGTVGNAGEIDVASGQTLTYGGVIANGSSAGGDQLTVGDAAGRNAGTLVLSGVNTYSGGTTINASLVYPIDSGQTLTLANPIDGPGTLTIQGAGTAIVTGRQAWAPDQWSITRRSSSMSRRRVPSRWQRDQRHGIGHSGRLGHSHFHRDK